jgi:hypothetical protein
VASLVYVPAPRTWSAGDVVKAPYLRSDVSGAIQLLSRPPMFLGSQTSTAQTVGDSAYVAVEMDTEAYDNFGGHEVSVQNGAYYGMFPGWYLVQCSIPLNSSSTSKATGAAVGGVQNGGSLSYFGGQLLADSSTAAIGTVAAKLMKMQQTGTFHGAANDYIVAAAFQDSGIPQPLLNAAAKYPLISVRWVCALSGTQPLPVPANPAWPAPPALATHAWANANIRDTVSFLVYPPVMEYSRASASGSLASQSSVPAVGTTVALDTMVVDNYGAFDNGTNTWTVPVAGVYWCYGVLAGEAGAGTVTLGAGLTVTSANYNGGTQITLWGGTAVPSAVSPAANVVRRRLRLSAGDTILLAGVQNDSGGAAFSYAGSAQFQCRLITVWESA